MAQVLHPETVRQKGREMNGEDNSQETLASARILAQGGRAVERMDVTGIPKPIRFHISEQI